MTTAGKATGLGWPEVAPAASDDVSRETSTDSVIATGLGWPETAPMSDVSRETSRQDAS